MGEGRKFGRLDLRCFDPERQSLLPEPCTREARVNQNASSMKFDENQYRQFFTRLTTTAPYEYQVELAKNLAEGQSVILRAPTGSGKTWATVAPFLYTCIKAQHAKFADKLLYALPLRSLASNLYKSTVEQLRTLDEPSLRVSGEVRNRKYLSDDPFYVGLQMGGQQDDPFFEGDITFTTIDQLLSSYLFAPVSLPQRIGNIGAGALIGSLLIFDEIHLLDPQRSLATVIEMLDRLKGLAQFVLMTATMPNSVLNWLENKLSAKIRSLCTDEVLALPSHFKKQRSFRWVSRSMNADDIVSQHQDRTIAILNTVGRAQSLYREVCEKVKTIDSAPEVFLLHSRFYPEDRQHWESKLHRYFGPKAPCSNAILISTQVVEAGIDISADVLLTELAPLNSLIQRAGRVARYENRNVGQFVVFGLPVDSQGRSKLGPYRSDAELVNTTKDVLAVQGEQSSISYLNELDWLEKVHGRSDLAALIHLESLYSHRKHVREAMDGLDKSAHSRLIREISSISVVLTNRPESLRLEARKWPKLLSVPRSSLFQLKEAVSSAQPPNWVFKVPNETESDSNGDLNVTWRVCRNPSEATWLVAINPAFACYSREIGLELGNRSSMTPEVPYTLSAPMMRYSYRRESLVFHSKRVVEHGRRILAHCSEMLQIIGQLYPDVPAVTLFELACALHDTGKLQIAWQSEASRWQEYVDAKLAKDPRKEKDEPLAHTDFDPIRDKGGILPKFPPHAACGGFALLEYFLQYYSDNVALTLCTAITRHHGAHSKQLANFQLPETAASIVEACLPDAIPRPVKLRLRPERSDIESFSDTYLLHFSADDSYWPLYTALVRVLRLADQGSFQEQS
jgi:CRISPR-associated endonuclease/helicase Cas3